LLSPIGSWGWTWPRVWESYPGAWQQNVVVDQTLVPAYWAVFSCVTLIASDISKLPARVMQRNKATGVFKETFLRPVLQKPNHFQTHLEFFFTWIVSQLLNGNTYVLKRRNPQGFVDAMYILSPNLVTPLIADDGSIFYQLQADNIAGLKATVTVPASEIIHDRMYTLHHPLIGVSPIYACGVAAMQGMAIQGNSAKFFQNMSRPGGILTAPGAISNETALRLKESWETNFGAGNIGKVAVLGDGLKYEAMTVTAHDSQLIEQLKMTAEMVCACYHVPGYKIGVGPMPTVSNTAALNQQYYDQCLQYPIEKMELRLDEGLELAPPFEVWMDLSGLLRMDPQARYASHNEAIRGGWLKPNEARIEEDLEPVDGGDTPYMQQQNYSLSALARRDDEDAEGTTDVQSAAMNGAQVTSLQGLITAAANGEIPVGTAEAAIAAAFPLLTPAQVTAMMSPLRGFEPVAPPPAAPPAAPEPEPEPAPGEGEEDQTELALLALFHKAPESYAHA
jgi:HK97 family phage portal protein